MEVNALKMMRNARKINMGQNVKLAKKLILIVKIVVILDFAQNVQKDTIYQELIKVVNVLNAYQLVKNVNQ